MNNGLNQKNIEETKARLGQLVSETPSFHWKTTVTDRLFGSKTDIFLKLELFQKTGTFKPRGALNVMMNLPKDKLDKGVTAVSAGNHAIAVAYAAQCLGTSAKVVMTEYANTYRVEKVKSYGAEIVFTKDFHIAFDEAERLQKEEGRTFVHPFEGPHTFLGTATCGLEFARQAPDLDIMIIAIGGGGLCAGFSSALKLLQPDVMIYGVEPLGANTMYRSFQSGQPENISKIETIADSLGSPMSLPEGVQICRQNLEEIVLVEDDEMLSAMRLLYDDMKLAVEPAGAAATAALMGPLNRQCKGKRVGILVCGSNIPLQIFAS